MNNNIKEELKSIIDLFNHFQESIKNFEFSFKVEPPTISQDNNSGFANNDLKYALRSSLSLLELSHIEDNKKSRKQLGFLQTAIHILYNDLFDYTLAFCVDYSNNLYDDYNAEIIHKIAINEITNLKNIIKDCKPKISKSRKYREERLQIYEELYQNEYPKLLNTYNSLLNKAESIYLEQEEYNATLKKYKQRSNISIAITSISIIVTIIAIFI